MGGFFSAQLELLRVTKNAGCKRSDDCLESGVKMGELPVGGYPVEVCSKCQRNRSIAMPPHLGYPASVATRLENLKEGGARFDYPNALTPFEWSAIEGLQRARRIEQIESDKEMEKEADLQRRKAELKHIAGR